MIGGLIPHEALRSMLHGELGARNGEPRDVSGAVVASAHRAVAVHAEKAWKLHYKANSAAQASAGNFLAMTHPVPSSSTA